MAISRKCLDQLILKLQYAPKGDMPICQDTGMACVFVEMDTEVL